MRFDLPHFYVVQKQMKYGHNGDNTQHTTRIPIEHADEDVEAKYKPTRYAAEPSS